MPWIDRKNPCRCSEACFYCDRPLAPTRHDHDHFPIPNRHGGTELVAACHECHTCKDLTEFGVHHINGELVVDEHIFKSIMAGMADLPPAVDAETGESVPFVMFVLQELLADLHETGQVESYGLADSVETYAGFVRSQVRKCTTPEARIWLARAFCLYLDVVDDVLAGR